LLRSLITTTADPDVDTALDWYGLELDRGTIAITGEPGEGPVRSDLGVLWEEDNPGLVVSVVLDGSGGSAAGLMPGDEILAIGDERLTKDKLESLMTSYSPGEKTELLVSRRGKIIRLDIKLDVAVPDHFEIVLKTDFEKRDISRLQSLLGQDPRKKP
jgi:predicted metalloprotease with PDZ domain